MVLKFIPLISMVVIVKDVIISPKCQKNDKLIAVSYKTNHSGGGKGYASCKGYASSGGKARSKLAW